MTIIEVIDGAKTILLICKLFKMFRTYKLSTKKKRNRKQKTKIDSSKWRNVSRLLVELFRLFLNLERVISD